MILPFESSEELDNFATEAARAAASVTEGIGALQLIRPTSKVGEIEHGRRLSSARAIMTTIMRAHAVMDPYEIGRKHKPVSVYLEFRKDVEPVTAGDGSNWQPISYPMIGWMLGRCHSTLVRAVGGLMEETGAGNRIGKAQAYLAESYGNETIETKIRFVKVDTERERLIGRGMAKCPHCYKKLPNFANYTGMPLT